MDEQSFYGLGVEVQAKQKDYGLSAGAFGWSGAAGSYILVDPAKKVSVVIGSSMKNWPQIFSDGHEKIWKEVYGLL